MRSGESFINVVIDLPSHCHPKLPAWIFSSGSKSLVLYTWSFIHVRKKFFDSISSVGKSTDQFSQKMHGGNIPLGIETYNSEGSGFISLIKLSVGNIKLGNSCSFVKASPFVPCYKNIIGQNCQTFLICMIRFCKQTHFPPKHQLDLFTQGFNRNLFFSQQFCQLQCFWLFSLHRRFFDSQKLQNKVRIRFPRSSPLISPSASTTGCISYTMVSMNFLQLKMNVRLLISVFFSQLSADSWNMPKICFFLNRFENEQWCLWKPSSGFLSLTFPSTNLSLEYRRTSIFSNTLGFFVLIGNFSHYFR